MTPRAMRRWAARRAVLSGLVVFGTLAMVALIALPGAASAAGRRSVRFTLNPNTASVVELQNVPGLGPTLAQRIVEYRERSQVQPAFSRLEDLDVVGGLGPVRLARVAPYLTFPMPRADAAAHDNPQTRSPAIP